MSPGALIYKVRKTLRHGPKVAWYRDMVRPRILLTRTVALPPDSSCEIHVLTSSGDWLNLIWTLKTFYHFSRRSYALCIHDDGTLPKAAHQALRRHFPRARMILRPEADSAVLPELANFPRCLELRKTNMLSLKLFDFRHFLRAERMLLIDSDILFFAEPSDLLRRIEDPGYRLNSVNADVQSAYTVDPATVKQTLGFEMGPRFNSGLGLIHRDSLRLDWIEEFLALPGILDHFWRIEQTLFALCSFRFGSELLPDEYRVQLEGETRGSCRHYIGAIRHLMYGQGMSRLVRSGFLKEMMDT